MRHSYESAVFDLFHTIVDPEEFRPKSYRRVEFVAQALNLDLQSFTSYWSNTLALRTIDRSQTIVKLIEAYLTLHGKRFDEEAVVRVDREMGRYQDMAILNPRPEIISALQTLGQRGLKLGLLSDCDERDIRGGPNLLWHSTSTLYVSPATSGSPSLTLRRSVPSWNDSERRLKRLRISEMAAQRS